MTAAERVQYLERATRLAPTTLNIEAGTVELVWTSGATVRRQGWGGAWDEELVVSAEAVDLSRLRSGRAPLLAAHRAYDLKDVIGVVEDAWLAPAPGGGLEGRARVRFSDRDDVQPVIADVQAGILRSVSVGYVIHKADQIERRGQPPLVRATRWEPMELSLVPIPADAAARVRGQSPASGASQMERTLLPGLSGWAPAPVQTREIATPPAQVVAPPQAAPPPDPAELERQRCREILEYCSIAKVGTQRARQLVMSGMPAEQVRQQLAAEWSAATPETTMIRNTHTGGTLHAPAVQGSADPVRGAVEYLAYRLSGGRTKLGADGEPYRGATLLDLGRSLLEAGGARPRHQAEVADWMLTGATRSFMGRSLGGLHTTSDFAAILADAGDRALEARFQAMQPALTVVSRRTEVADFRTVTRIRLGEGSGLLPIEEHGEVKAGTIGEHGESYQVRSYGRKFGFTRKLIVNDDLGAIQDFIDNIATLSARTLGDVLYDAINLNAALSDGTPLFHANHGNLGAPAELSIASLDLARKAMRGQTGVDGGRISVVPKYLVVGPARETLATQLLTQLNATTVDDVNPFAGRLQLVVEDRIPDNRWYLFADPAVSPALEYAHLDGSRPMSSSGPRVETFYSIDVDGIAVRVLYDVGAGVVAHQAVYRNPGA